MDENEKFIQENLSSLLSKGPVKAKTQEIGGDWHLHEIGSVHPMPRNIEFGLILVNGEKRCVNVLAKINRATAKFSNIKVDEM